MSNLNFAILVWGIIAAALAFMACDALLGFIRIRVRLRLRRRNLWPGLPGAVLRTMGSPRWRGVCRRAWLGDGNDWWKDEVTR